MSETIKVDKFVADQIEELREFQKHWNKMMTIHPNSYPAEMLRGEWQEQLDFYERKP